MSATAPTGFAIARDDASAAFFDGAARGELLVPHCDVCGRWFAPHHDTCPDGHPTTRRVASGRAVLVSWAVDVAPPLDAALATPDGAATVCGLVELAEAPWTWMAVVGVEPAALRAGMALTVGFVQPGDGEWVPVATPAPAG